MSKKNKGEKDKAGGEQPEQPLPPPVDAAPESGPEGPEASAPEDSTPRPVANGAGEEGEGTPEGTPSTTKSDVPCGACGGNEVFVVTDFRHEADRNERPLSGAACANVNCSRYEVFMTPIEAFAMTSEEVLAKGGTAPPPLDPTHADLRNAVLTGKMTALEAAKACFQLEDRHVLDSRAYDGGVSIVTAGGQKLQWPRDEARVLSPMEKGEKAGVKREPVGIKRFERDAKD